MRSSVVPDKLSSTTRYHVGVSPAIFEGAWHAPESRNRSGLPAVTAAENRRQTDRWSVSPCRHRTQTTGVTRRHFIMTSL